MFAIPGPICRFCKGPAESHGQRPFGYMLGPLQLSNGREVFVHRACALWSPEVFQTDKGTLKNIKAALTRSTSVRCEHCGHKGATLGCRVSACPCSYHLPCAQPAGCALYLSQYLLACPRHRAVFSETLPAAAPLLHHPEQAATPGPTNLLGRVDPEEHMAIAQQAAKRARSELRHRAMQGPVESDDEEHFAKQERQRWDRDRARLAPIILGRRATGGSGPSEKGSAQQMAAGQHAQQDYPGFEAVGGHNEAAAQLLEITVLPLLYPDLLCNLSITPPRGVLFHGPPGTGKTLMARALAGACARASPKPVAFFARKGADCLGKFAGDAERTLRLLFQEAQRRAPAIIFLDELDGLAPARAVREGGADQTYASLVSTLLSLMDGLHDRGHVIVIGATNRPDSVDPALRRPGRFDREVYLGLPESKEREAILNIHTSKWPQHPTAKLLGLLAEATQG
ncbi:hypothetical protein WJX84_007609, partial [Apatococcus fuscideae]